MHITLLVQQITALHWEITTLLRQLTVLLWTLYSSPTSCCARALKFCMGISAHTNGVQSSPYMCTLDRSATHPIEFVANYRMVELVMVSTFYQHKTNHCHGH